MPPFDDSDSAAASVRPDWEGLARELYEAVRAYCDEGDDRRLNFAMEAYEQATSGESS